MTPTGTVADRFETFMASFLAKTLRSTLTEGPLSDGPVAMFADFLDEQIGQEIARSGSLDGLSRNLPGGTEPAGPTASHVHPAGAGRGEETIARLTSGFGVRKDPIDGTQRTHHGIDLGAPTGTPIHASGEGRVVYAGPRGGYGNLVVIDHGNGFKTRYAHCDTVQVEVGQAVKSGDEIAAVGNTGRSTGPHLHFEVRHDDTPVDPADWLRGNRAPLGR